MVRDGIFTSLNPETGDVYKQARLSGAQGRYWSWPIAADGKIYLASEKGKVVVVRANAEWEILAVNNLNEEIFATPAILEGRILYPDARGAVLFREAIDCALAGPIRCDRSMSTRVPGRVHQARLNGAPVDPPHR